MNVTHEVVEKFFTGLENGDLAVLELLADDVEFELPVDRHNAVIPYLGTHRGRDEVARAFAVRAEVTEVLDYRLRDLRVDGGTAFAVIYTKAAHRRTGVEFEIEDVHRLEVADGRIARWKVYFDPNAAVAAFTGGDGTRVDGLTPLMIAAARADVETTRLLLEAGASPHTMDSKAGCTPLHKACQGGSVEVARLLVEAGAFVDAVAPTTGHTPFMDALWYKHPELVRYLLDQNASLHLRTHYGFSLAEHIEYERNVNVDDEGIRAAEEHVSAEMERRNRNSSLLEAVKAGDTELVRQLVRGSDVDERHPVVNGFNDGHTPLLIAARDGHTEIARLLLDAGADVNATEPTFGAVPLHKAVYNGHLEMTKLLVGQPGVDLDYQGPTNGYTPLRDALWHGHDECARVLIEAGADETIRGHDGR